MRFEVMYATSRLARVDAVDMEQAKRRFAAYALYGDASEVSSDVELSFGDDAEVAPLAEPLPPAAPPGALRDWLARRDASSESFETGLFEDPQRALDRYLRLLAVNDPWRLEGHGSLGRPLAHTPICGLLTTFDARVRYRFDATQFFDYVRRDVIEALDPCRPRDSVRVESLVDVSALRDDALRQIASSYDTITNEMRLTEQFADAPAIARAYDVAFETDDWRDYLAERRAYPERFLPPAGWTSAFPGYGEET